jgi:hypothetical protein
MVLVKEMLVRGFVRANSEFGSMVNIDFRQVIMVMLIRVPSIRRELNLSYCSDQLGKQLCKLQLYSKSKRNRKGLLNS